MSARIITSSLPSQEPLPVPQLLPVHSPRLLTQRTPDDLNRLSERAITVTLLLQDILAHNPVPHVGIND